MSSRAEDFMGETLPRSDDGLQDRMSPGTKAFDDAHDAPLFFPLTRKFG
jgi:hypothetical protein